MGKMHFSFPKNTIELTSSTEDENNYDNDDEEDDDDEVDDEGAGELLRGLLARVASCSGHSNAASGDATSPCPPSFNDFDLESVFVGLGLMKVTKQNSRLLDLTCEVVS